jgi:hypothetical protein
MVHLELAYLVGVPPETADLGRYLLGAIAPDGIHARVSADRDDKRRVHLMEPGEALATRLARFDGLLRSEHDGVHPEFLRGWATHLAADALWSRYFGHGYWDRHSVGMTAAERTQVYYRETDKTDFLLYRSAPWREQAWTALREADPCAFPGYLGRDEVCAWRDRLLVWFTDLKEEPVEEPQHFTMERVRRFCRFAARACAVGFEAGFVAAAEWAEGNHAVEFLAPDE